MVDITVYVDESGTITLNKPTLIRQYPFFVVGFVICRQPYLLQKGMKKLLIKLHKRRKYYRKIMELKFNPYSALEKQGCLHDEIQTKWEPYFDYVRKKTNFLITDIVDGIFVGILDQRTINIWTWTPETLGNFLFNRSLYDDVLPNIGNFNNCRVIYDKGRLDSKRTKNFNRYLRNTQSFRKHFGIKRYAGNVTEFKDIDSLSDPGIWAADFVAGSFRRAYLYNDRTYMDILTPKLIGNGERKLWFR